MNKNKHIDDEILIAYLIDEITDKKQISEVEEWLKSSEKNQQQFDDLKKTWFGVQKLTPKPVAVDINAAWLKFEQRIDNEHITHRFLFNKKIINILRIAAILIIFVGLFFIFKEKNTNSTIILATTDSLLTDTLIDGSIITLNEKSTISFKKDFGQNQRTIKLEGEAFFEVDHDTEKPFIIDAGGGYIQVVGTKFNVNTNDSVYIDVFVEEGIVKIFSIDPDSSDTLFVLLTAGQKGRINTVNGETIKLNNNTQNPNDLFWKTNILTFNSCFIKDVANTLEDVYGVNFIIDDKAKSLLLTATFENAQIDEILEIIKLTLNLEISKIDKTYYLNVIED
ncbi:MAG: FecR family protein [Bacteroidales bacterium]|nr:FecR family protein [Bacteroidales bacterium]